tara:strand:+ start:267 stop:1883 length:1617 start_codon:yes stop_codon:yes gene_type:complete
MKKYRVLFVSLLFFSFSFSQNKLQKINQIVNEANNNSQLESLAHELIDQIGPRLTGTPQMQKAHDWVVETYSKWNINAKNEQFGQWRAWERGISHMDMMSPWVKSLEGQQLSWSASTKRNGELGEVVTIPFESKEVFDSWLKTIKGKHVLFGTPDISGRPDYDIERWAKEKTLEDIRRSRISKRSKDFRQFRKTGYGFRDMMKAIEAAKPSSIITSTWTYSFGTNQIFSPGAFGISQETPTVDISMEDFGLLYRLSKNGQKPTVNINVQSKELGKVPTYNSLARIEGTEKSDEYVILSAHLDTTGGGTGATDNGTGTITMMEVMRILKKIYPNPKRTIIAAHWGAEEQGLNGSSAFVEDNPEIVENLQALFNQDNGTGRIAKINGHGFTEAYRFIGQWLEYVPSEIKDEIQTTFPGVPIPRYEYEENGVTVPAGGSSDWRNFVSSGVPGFNLSSLDFSYGGYSPYHYTWHTNRDTYDKIIFDDVRDNVILIAILTYLASEEDELMPRTRRILPIDPLTGERQKWPSLRIPNRDGSEDN